jgi:single-strand DNA-binding protein
MASYNKVQLIGNLTRDIELRYTPKGSPVADMAIAVNRKWKDDQGQIHEEVTFVDIGLWGKTAESCAKYLKKGSPAFVDGRLELQTWNDKQTGEKRSKLRVIAEGVQFLGSGQQQQGGERGYGDRPAPQPQPAPQQQTAQTRQADDFDDIPW